MLPILRLTTRTIEMRTPPLPPTCQKRAKLPVDASYRLIASALPALHRRIKAHYQSDSTYSRNHQYCSNSL